MGWCAGGAAFGRRRGSPGAVAANTDAEGLIMREGRNRKIMKFGDKSIDLRCDFDCSSIFCQSEAR